MEFTRGAKPEGADGFQQPRSSIKSTVAQWNGPLMSRLTGVNAGGKTFASVRVTAFYSVRLLRWLNAVVRQLEKRVAVNAPGCWTSISAEAHHLIRCQSPPHAPAGATVTLSLLSPPKAKVTRMFLPSSVKTRRAQFDMFNTCVDQNHHAIQTKTRCNCV